MKTKKDYSGMKLKELGTMDKHEKCGKFIPPKDVEIPVKDRNKFCQCEPEKEGPMK